MQAWVDYDGMGKQLNVTISPINGDKPNMPLLSLDIDLSPVVFDRMYAGFASTVGVHPQSYYVLGWSFQLSGKARELDLSRLPSLERKKEFKKRQVIVAIGLALLVVLLVSTIIFVALSLARRKAKVSEILEDWEFQYGPHRFLYKDLHVATKGFKENELLGRGGFGQVYKGQLPLSNIQVAVKKISHESNQGMKEFVAEIATIGRLRHPNLVRLLGYCKRDGELYLVYDFMPNASLDKFLFKNPKVTLNWNQRFKIIADVASGLTYLHEQWVEVIIHRDIKASNVLLDKEFSAKLGDFGLARCGHDGKDPQTSRVAGTLGYIAPELVRNGKATTGTDVFAFGAFCLEVACGRRPVELQAPPEEVVLVDWVLECWRKDSILKAADCKLNGDFKVEEMELVLKLGLLCSHPNAEIRPSMSQALYYLKGHATFPKNLDTFFNDFVVSNHSASEPVDSRTRISLTMSELFVGR